MFKIKLMNPEERKGSEKHSQVLRRTIAEDIGIWKDLAPKCKCGRDIVMYLCPDSECHKSDESMFMYCSMCLEDGEVHTKHKKHVRIVNAMRNF